MVHAFLRADGKASGQFRARMLVPGKHTTRENGGKPMGQPYSMLGFVVIVILYAVIGLMAAAGTIFIARKILAPKAEQIFYAMFLMMIAAFYLAFVAYFGVATAWRLETSAVVVFVVIGLLGARLPFALVVGYSLHGLWDLLHELQAHGAHSPFAPGQLTAIPLAYGFCCVAIDFCLAAYFYTRRAEWSALWKVAPQ
jgi:hypothetical protein